jgi:hypothetical protein
MPSERPTVNLDAVAGVLDRVLAHPTTQAAGQFMPETVRRLKKVRENLPEFASGVEAHVLERVKQEAANLEYELLGELGRFIDGAFRAARRRDKKPTKKKTKRLKR